ncbi:hypothetical protein FRB99_002629 [Tulasnella sp. 403]|nr:hypothetical protein FRB99_002629 [Tulasnella sp. 403]
MSGRKIGTVIVVVLKAKNLPNKRHIGKQDPYCVLKLDDQTRRTKAVKRGGQHPEWDDELRFPLYETAEEELQRTAGDGDAPLPPPKDNAKPKKQTTKKIMSLSCYADDPREPDLIGETTVDLTEALTKGETDEWFTLYTKQKYCGEVYLEITFWSEEEPPVKQQPPPQSTLQPIYGGRGSFVPAGEIPASLRTGQGRISTGGMSQGSGGGRPSAGRQSTGGEISPNRTDSIPDALKPSGSLAKLDLYIPSYSRENRPATAHPDAQAGSHYGKQPSYDNERYSLSPGGYDEFGAAGYSRRRESFPPPPGGHPRHSSYGSIAPSIISLGHDGLSNSFSTMSINGPPVSGYPPGPVPPSSSFPAGHQGPYPTPSGFQPPPSGFVPPVPQPTPTPGLPFQQYPPRPTYGGPPPNPQQPFLPPSSSMGFYPPASGFHQPSYPPNPSATPAPYPVPTPTPLPSFPPQPSATPVPYAANPQPPYPNYSSTPAPYQQSYPNQQQYPPSQYQQPAYQAPPPPQPQQPLQYQPPPTNGYYNGTAPPPSVTPNPPVPLAGPTPPPPQPYHSNSYPPSGPPPSVTSQPYQQAPPPVQGQSWLSTPGQQVQPLPSPPPGPGPSPRPVAAGALPVPPPPPPPLFPNNTTPSKPLPLPGQLTQSPSSAIVGGSRPLPTPGQVPQQHASSLPAPPPPSTSPPGAHPIYDQNAPPDDGGYGRNSSMHPPPPPVLPQQSQGFFPPPPPPPLPFQAPPPPPPISHWR